MASRIQATRIVVKPDRLVCTLQLSADCPRMSSPALMHTLLKAHPLLAAHACKNKKGSTFESVMNHTALIHVVEHVAIDCQVQKNPQSDQLFVGNSQWIDKKAGIGCVELSFCDDVEALAALKCALAQINEALE